MGIVILTSLCANMVKYQAEFTMNPITFPDASDLVNTHNAQEVTLIRVNCGILFCHSSSQLGIATS